MTRKKKDAPNYRGELFRKTFTYQGKKYYVTSTNEDDLMRKVIEKKMTLERGEIIINKNTTVKQWVELWLETDKKPRVKQSTYNNIDSLVKNNILPEIRHYRLRDVQRQMLQKVLNLHEGGSFSHVSKIKIYLPE